MKPEIKICGMKYSENIELISSLLPDYFGFIFYKKSPRFFQETIPQLPKNIKKVGVFVNDSKTDILEKIKIHSLDLIQLHGDESPHFCKELKYDNSQIKIVKAFSIGNSFDFETLKNYLDTVDFFLFDTKGKQPGGNGITFNWNILKEYPFEKPFFLSGGIGLENIKELLKLLEENLPIHAIDINSKFEDDDGLKNYDKLKEFITKL